MPPHRPLTRLRKPFKSPPSSSSEELDEEHQEKLITTLQTTDAAKNNLYRNLFLTLPLLALLLTLKNFLSASTSAREKISSLLGATSLGCSAYILQYMRLEKGAWRGKMAAKGPVERYLVWLNGGLVVVLGVAAIGSFRKGEVEDAGREVLPGVMFGLILFVRGQLAPVDLEELQKARYELKGA